MTGWLLPNSAIVSTEIQRATREYIVHCGIPWLPLNSGRDVCLLCSRPATLCLLFFSAVFAVAAYTAWELFLHLQGLVPDCSPCPGRSPFQWPYGALYIHTVSSRDSPADGGYWSWCIASPMSLLAPWEQGLVRILFHCLLYLSTQQTQVFRSWGGEKGVREKWNCILLPGLRSNGQSINILNVLH